MLTQRGFKLAWSFGLSCLALETHEPLMPGGDSAFEVHTDLVLTWLHVLSVSTAVYQCAFSGGRQEVLTLS